MSYNLPVFNDENLASSKARAQSVVSRRASRQSWLGSELQPSKKKYVLYPRVANQDYLVNASGHDTAAIEVQKTFLGRDSRTFTLEPRSNNETEYHSAGNMYIYVLECRHHKQTVRLNGSVTTRTRSDCKSRRTHECENNNDMC